MISVLLTVISPYTAVLPMFYLALRVLQKNEFIYKNPLNSGLFLLFIWSFLVGLLNMNPVSSAASIAILLYLLVSVYFQNNYNDEEKIEKLFKNIILFSIGSAFIGIIEKFAAVYSESIWWGPFFGIPSQVLVRQDYRIYSTFGNPNVAGSWFATMILICIYFYDNSFMYKKIFYAGTTLLFTLVLDMTGSRGAALGLELGLVVYAYFRKRKDNIWFLICIFLSIIMLMFVGPQLFPKINGLNNTMNHSMGYSVNGRQAIWLGCLNMFKLKPVTGWGLMGIYFADSDVFRYVREFHGHNIWITLATTLGIVGLGIYLHIKYYLFESIRFLSGCHCRLTPLLAGIQAVVIGHGLVDFTIMTPQGGIIFFGCSAIISALAIQYSNSKVDEHYPIPALVNKKRLQNQ